MSNSDHKQQYENAYPAYKRLTSKLKSLLEEFLNQNGIKATIQSRTKEVDSFLKKIRSNKVDENPLQKITDLSGIRIILNSLTDIEPVCEIIRKEFYVDPDNSIDKKDQLADDRFGYLSRHFIVKISDSRKHLLEWKEISNLCAEIQVRTILQHAWATVSHFLFYKNEYDSPKELRRRLFRLSALFELADEELERIVLDRQKQIAKYARKFEKENTKVEINVDSLKSYIQTAAEPKYWAKLLREKTGQWILENDWGDLSRDIRLAKKFHLDSIEDIDNLLKKAHDWGELFFVNYFREHFKRTNTPPALTYTVINGPVTMLMIAANIENIDEDTLRDDFGWGPADMLINIAMAARGIKKPDSQ